MGWEYARSDELLVQTNSFRLQLHQAAMGGPIPGCGETVDGDGQQVKAPSGVVDIEFQFPPKILSDGRRGNWTEQEMGGGQEPVAVYKTSGPRTLSLAWTYVVDSDGSSGWTIPRITKNVRTLRGYFANVRDYGSTRDALAVMFKMWCIGGQEEITARIVTVDVKYGEALVYSGSDMRKAYPLRTDIVVDLRVWTKGLRTTSIIGSGKDAVPVDLKTQLGQQDLRILTEREPPEWY